MAGGGNCYEVSARHIWGRDTSKSILSKLPNTYYPNMGTVHTSESKVKSREKCYFWPFISKDSGVVKFLAPHLESEANQRFPQVVLVVNSRPTLNDVTKSEMDVIMQSRLLSRNDSFSMTFQSHFSVFFSTIDSLDLIFVT